MRPRRFVALLGLVVLLLWSLQPPDDDVTLVLQFTVDRIPEVLLTLERWPGPTAMAVAIRGPDDRRYLALLPAPFVAVEVDRPYPINRLRNLARSLVKTRYYLYLEADMIPDRTLYAYVRAQVLPMMAWYPMRIYVVPFFKAYGTLSDLSMRDLVLAVKAGQVRPPMLRGAIDPGHRATDYPRWLRAEEPFKTCYFYGWEPYGVEPVTTPAYDERFTNQGGDKQVHLMLLQALGHQWWVIPEHWVLEADKEQERWTDFSNSSLFDGFARSIEQDYPGSLQRCN